VVSIPLFYPPPFPLFPFTFPNDLISLPHTHFRKPTHTFTPLTPLNPLTPLFLPRKKPFFGEHHPTTYSYYSFHPLSLPFLALSYYSCPFTLLLLFNALILRFLWLFYPVLIYLSLLLNY
jgi:hypothetical protein